MRGATQQSPGGVRGSEANRKTAYQYRESYREAETTRKANEGPERQALRNAWRESTPITRATAAIPVTLYFTQGCGLGEIAWQMPDDLRFHPGLSYWDTRGKEANHVGDYPAMLAVVRAPGGQPVTLHRTYLTHGGKQAPVSEPRKLMPAALDGATTGSAIRLYPPGATLAVAQGIESALAVRLATGLPVWAALDADGLRALEVPEGIENLAIYADHEAASIEAAQELGRRIADQGRQTRIAVPPEEGAEWASVPWAQFGIEGGGR